MDDFDWVYYWVIFDVDSTITSGVFNTILLIIENTFLYLIREAAKKSSSLNGRAIKA